MTRIGSLFSGYGGLDLAIMDVIPGASVAWHVEFDKAPAAILAHHWPDVPNHHDVTTVDWSAVEPVDIITGGFPCQDLSHAGKRAGLRPGTRSGLWSHMAYAVNILRPRLVVIENVLGILSARAAGDVEPCALCLGDDAADAVRALGAVCADLAALGYDARWTTVRAADAGACHGRARVFIVAHPNNVGSDRRELVPRGGADLRTIIGTFADSDGGRLVQRDAGKRDVQLADQIGEDSVDLLPAPGASAHKSRLGGGSQQSRSLEARGRRGEFPTPDAHRSGRSEHGRPEPMDEKQPAAQHARSDVHGGHAVTDFGPYADAISRHEVALGRPAPAPTEPGKNGPRLSPAFVEWMMMLPAGHVTDTTIGLSRSQQLKALGNGVVPAEAALALRLLLGIFDATERDGGALLPTPNVKNNENRQSSGYGPNLGEALAMLPTPRASDGPNGGPGQRNGRGDADTLSAISALLPTPTPFQMSNSETPDEWLTRRKDVVKRTGTHHGLPLPVAAVAIAEGKPILMSDPTASEDEWGVGNV